MKEKDLNFFRNLLTGWLNELLLQADGTVDNLRESVDVSSDPLDLAATDLERSFRLRIRDRERALIDKIKQSLDDIEAGVYGLCEDCGEEISIKRLKARPVARRCIQCKTKQEALEKIIGQWQE